MEYSSEVRRRLVSPVRLGSCEDARGPFTYATAEDRTLNVWLRVRVQLNRGRIVSVRCEAYGCPHFVAAVDWIAEWLEGRAVGVLREPVARAAGEALDVPTEKLGKLLVIEDALAASAALARCVPD